MYRRGCFLLTNEMDQRVVVRWLERGVLAFFLLAALFLVVVYVILVVT